MIGWKPGQKVSEPGIYPSIPIQEYHGDLCVGHSVSHTGLDRIFNQSLAHYWAKCYANPDRQPDEPTEAMTLGSAAHHLFLGQREFQKHFIRRPETLLGEKWQGNRTVCKEWLAKQARAGLTVLKPDHIDAVTGMAKSLAAEPLVQAGILSGRVECSLVWQDRETGIWCKARPDSIPSDRGDFVDLKTAASVTEEALEKAIGSFGYVRQGAWICEGMAALQGLPLVFRPAHDGEGFSFSLVFVETSPPWCCQIVTLKAGDLERGVYQNRLALRLLARSLKTGVWPGPGGSQRDARYMGITTWQETKDTWRSRQIEGMLAIGDAA